MPRKKPVTEGGRENNAQLIARLMDFAKCGPIAQLFIIEGVRRYAALCADGDLSKMDLGPISGAQWKRAAAEIHEEISKHLGE